MKTLEQFTEGWANHLPEIHGQYGGQSASHTDPEGYTVTVTAKNGDEPLSYPGEDPRNTRDFGQARSGYMTITHPDGRSVRGGFWMDNPESGWTHPNAPGVDLHKDYFDHVDRGSPASAWHTRVPIEDRLAMEAKQQATAYRPLKVEFAERERIQKSRG